MKMDGMIGYGLGFHGFGWIFWLLILFFVFFLIRPGSDSSEQPDKSALDILKERYAKDEITKEEYEDMKRQII